MTSIYQTQIDRLNDEITKVSGVLNQICCETVTGEELACCMNTNKSRLENKLAGLQTQKTIFEGMISRINQGWPTEKQTVVDEIEGLWPGVYSGGLQRMLVVGNTEEINTFFMAYSQATNNFQKEQLLIATFQ